MKKGTSLLLKRLLCLLTWVVALATTHASEKPTVISLSPAATELIYELKLDSHLIAVDQNSNYPEQAKNLPNIGDPFYPNLELLAQYQPDLLIHFSNYHALETAQKTFNFTLLPMQPRNMEELFAQAEQLANHLYHNRNEQIQRWHQQWHAINQQYKNTTSSSSRKVFVFLGTNPLYTLGKNAFLSQSLHTCGVKGLFDDQDYPSLIISKEQLAIQPPDKVLAGLSSHDNTQQRIQQIIDIFKSLGVFLTEKQIVLVDQDILFRPTIRFLNYLPTLCKRLQ